MIYINKLKKILYILYIIIIIKIFKKKYNSNFINVKGQINKFKIKLKMNNKIKISNKTFKKNIILIFFGYSLCPDICPKLLKNIKNNIKYIKNYYKLKFFFFSINWKKENSELTQKYLSKLKTKNIIGANSTGKNTEKISNNFRIIYKYNKKKINHSSVIYIINKFFNCIFMEINKKSKNFLRNI